MKRFLTPFFILTITTIVYCVYIWIVDETGWGTFLTIYLGIFAIVIFAIDFFLYKGTKSFRKTSIVELIIIGLCCLVLGYQKRKKTLIINDQFEKEYISIIYEVENEIDLSISPLNWTKEIEIPKNGILLTSSDFHENLPKTNIKFESGISVNNKASDKGFSEFPESEFISQGKTYKYRSWKIQKGFCCSWSSRELDSLAIELKKQFERIKASR